ncbi:MAG: DUF4255 domain-containing protein [Gemmatimonadetes bacterium]|nr:DUF4255 domain-containing protein [Gemmatimonadota bacterium]
MSDYTVIKLVNERLRQLLFDGMVGEAAQYFTGIDAIHVGSPKETAELANTQPKRLSIFLYQVTEDPHMKNRPPVRANGATRLRIPPLALRFHYMITPFVPDPDGNALVLGKILEVLYDNSTIVITDPLSGEAEEVRVIFETLSLAELAEVWEALREPYRVSLAYQLRVPRLQSRRHVLAAPVGEANQHYGGVP